MYFTNILNSHSSIILYVYMIIEDICSLMCRLSFKNKIWKVLNMKLLKTIILWNQRLIKVEWHIAYKMQAWMKGKALGTWTTSLKKSLVGVLPIQTQVPLKMWRIVLKNLVLESLRSSASTSIEIQGPNHIRRLKCSFLEYFKDIIEICVNMYY